MGEFAFKILMPHTARTAIYNIPKQGTELPYIICFFVNFLRYLQGGWKGEGDQGWPPATPQKQRKQVFAIVVLDSFLVEGSLIGQGAV